LLSLTINELEKNHEKLELTTIRVLHNNRKMLSDSIKAHNYQNNEDSFYYTSDSLVLPIQMFDARSLLKYNRAKSVALNIYHTLVVK